MWLPLPYEFDTALVHMFGQRAWAELQWPDQVYPPFVGLFPGLSVGKWLADLHEEHHHEGTWFEAQLLLVAQRPGLE